MRGEEIIYKLSSMNNNLQMLRSFVESIETHYELFKNAVLESIDALAERDSHSRTSTEGDT
jgi:hypothetical protein